MGKRDRRKAFEEENTRKKSGWRGVLLFILLPLLAAGIWGATRLLDKWDVSLTPSALEVENREASQTLPEWILPSFIPVDGASRRGEALEGVEGIVIHYVGNPGTTARQNRDWFANPESEVSSHFVIGLDGEILMCVPLTEKSSASNEANGTTLSIEVCHPDETGKFTRESEEALVKLLAYLCRRFDLTVDKIIRHFDVTGKICPKYYVEHEDAYAAMKKRVEASLREDAA